MIEVIGLSKGYGRRRVLDNLSFRVRPGELALLVGANGCGKSTTLRLLAGLSSADGGRMLLSGRDVAADPAVAQAGVSFLPQSPRFHPRLTVAQILGFYARLRGLPAARIEMVIGRWGLAEFLDVVTGRLSGGTRQRLGLAILDLPDAAILMLDEPGLSLDPDWRRELQQRLPGAGSGVKPDQTRRVARDHELSLAIGTGNDQRRAERRGFDLVANFHFDSPLFASSAKNPASFPLAWSFGTISRPSIRIGEALLPCCSW